MLRIQKLLIFLLITSTITSYAQTVQSGKILEHNSNGKPLPNVTVKVQNAPATITDNEGQFHLQFSYLQPGDVILVEEISKKDYEIVNIKELEHWTLSPHQPFIIYMAKKGSIDQARMTYYQIGEENIIKIYNKNKELFKQQLDKQLITIEKYKEELSKAYEDRNKALSQLEQLADKFARINRDDMDSLNLKALQLFEQGRLAEVVELYEKEQSREKLSHKLVQQQEIKEDMNQLINVLLAENDYRQLLGGIKQYNQIELNLKEIIRTDSNNVEYLKLYSDFLYETGQNDAAIRMTENWLKKITDSVKTAEGCFNIAHAYITNRQYSKAEEPLKKAMTYLERVKRNDEENALLSEIYRSMSNYLLETTDKEEAEKYLQLSIDVLNKAMAVNQANFQTDLARSYQFLGFFHERTMQYTEAIVAFTIADSLYKKIYDQLTVQGKINYCSTLSEIGNCYTILGNLDYAHHYLVKSYQLSKALANDSLSTYLDNLAYCANNLGAFYNSINYCEEAIQYLSETVDLFAKTPSEKITELYNAYLNLGIAYKKTGQYDASVTNYDKSLQLAVQRYADDPVPAKLEDLAVVEDQYGAVLNMSGKYEEAVPHFNNSIKLYRQLTPTSTSIQKNYLSIALNNAASNYLDMDSPKEALKMYNESISIAKKLAKDNPDEMLHSIASVHNNLGYYYGSKKNYKKAVKYISEAASYLEELAKINPDYEIKELLLTKSNIAFLQHRAGNFDKSLEIYTSIIERARMALTRSGKAYLPVLAVLLENSGNLYVDMKMNEEAKANYSESLGIYQDMLSEAPDSYQPLIDRITTKLKNLSEKP